MTAPVEVTPDDDHVRGSHAALLGLMVVPLKLRGERLDERRRRSWR